MPKRRDENQIAFDAVQELIRRDAERDDLVQEPIPEPQKVPDAVRAGLKGDRRGGPARAKALSAKKRKQITREAAQARWSEKKE